MQGYPGTGVTIPVLLGGAEPIVQAANNDNSIDFMRVVVYDLRAASFLLQKSYNVVQDGFPFSSSTPICYSSTLKSSNPWTWAQLINDMGVCRMDPQNPQPSNLPTWTPYNLIFDNIPALDALDDVAGQIFMVVGFDYTQQFPYALQLFNPLPYTSSQFGSNNSGGTGQTLIGVIGSPPNVKIPDYGFQANADLMTQANLQGVIINGVPPAGDGESERNLGRLPGQISVTFPGSGGTDPYGAQRFYIKLTATGQGSMDFIVPLHIGNVIAGWNGSAWANQSALDAIAKDMVPRAVAWMNQPYGQGELGGIWPFKPDGIFRQIEWVSDEEGARTIVSGGNRFDWLPYKSLEDPIGLVSKQEVLAYGSGITGVTQSGVKFVTGGGGSLNSLGQYQYQVFQMVAQRVSGWDWPRFHAPV